MIRVHVLNVGKGSSTWIEFPQRLSVVDIDNSRAHSDPSLTNPLDYYRARFPGRDIFRFILTHPDMDHMSGLDELARTTKIHNFWDTFNDKKVSEWHAPYRKEDWERYQQLRRSKELPKCLRLHRHATADCCWTQDGLSILSP
ncbi:MAG: MBL fold metallo-hydrolase, partial [Rhodothermales bacterium]|nr:MBL fold metallo-hydrolase [Rhodothermales bacterium]